MKKDKKSKSKTIKPRVKLLIQRQMIINIILISFLFIGSMFLFTMASSISVEEHDLIIKYDEDSSIKYDVSLIPNAFYPTATLGMNQQYPTNAIDKINIKYNYNFRTDKISKYKYRYFTTATLVINNKNAKAGTNNLLLTRPYQLEEQVTGEEENDMFDIEKNYMIDYQVFNSFVNQYKNQYATTVDSYLKVSFYIEIIDEYSNNVISTNKSMDVSIPLSTNPVSITINNPQDKHESIYKETSTITTSSYFVIFAILMLITGILLFIQEIVKVVKSERSQSKYINKLNKILAGNSEVIVKAKNKIDLRDHIIIEVETMDALLDAQNELRIPIAYFETKPNKEGYFVIVNGNEIWRYILTIEEDK